MPVLRNGVRDFVQFVYETLVVAFKGKCLEPILRGGCPLGPDPQAAVALVGGLQHPAGAKDLDPLVETIDRAARVVDLAHPSAGSVDPATDLEEALGWADVISVSAPKAKDPLFGAAAFAAMKEGVIVVNTARGGIVDEGALIEALSSGKVAAAGLDVFEHEPPVVDDPLRRFDQVILSPHIAGVTEGASVRMALGSAQNIIDFLAGRIASDLVVNRAGIGLTPST